MVETGKGKGNRKRRNKSGGKNATGDTKKKTESIFDSIMKSELEHLPRLAIPLVNDVFESNHPEDAPIVTYGSEHINVWGKTFNDVTLRIGGVLYHLECQSATDSEMVLRMLEYDLALALSNANRTGSVTVAAFPKSCVLYLRHTKNTPDALLAVLTSHDNSAFVFKSKVVKVQLYSLDDIFEKRLLILFPFYLMRYNDNRISKIAQDKDLADELICECESVMARLRTETLDRGDETLYHSLVSFTVQVVEHLFVRHEELMRRVKEAMGGRYIETHEEKVARLSAEVRDIGAKLDDSEAERSGLAARLGDMEAKLDKTEAERNDLAARLGDSEAERNDLAARLGDSEAERNDLAARLGDMEAKLDETEAERSGLAARLGDMEAELSTMRDVMMRVRTLLEKPAEKYLEAHPEEAIQAYSLLTPPGPLG